MQGVTSGVVVIRSRGWRRFFLLLGMFFVAFVVAGFIPTPGSWSDVRSQWLDAAVVAVICILFIITSAGTYWRGGPLTGLQASLLCLIFGAIFVFMARELFTSMLFLREVRSHHASLRVQEPNKITGANAGGPRQLPMRTLRTARVAKF